jgi:transposase
MQDDVSRLVGIEGLVVTAVVELREHLELEVELALDAGCWRWCGRGSLKVKDRPVVRVRDLPVRVGSRGCCGASAGSIARRAGGRSPRRIRRCRRVSGSALGSVGTCSSAVAAAPRTWRSRATSGRRAPQVNRAFAVGGDELLERRESAPAGRLSLDEAHHRRSPELATIVSDLDRCRVVEVLDGRSCQVIERYLRSLSERERRAIRVVSIDPYDAYRQAIHNELPGARIVVDHFHLVRGANTALDSVRRDRQRERATRRPKGIREQAHRDRWKPELYRARHLLLKASERLTERQRRRLCALFERDPLLAEAWGLKEMFRSVYRARNRDDAERRLAHFLTAVEHAELRPFDAFAKGIGQWHTELLAYFDEPTTNGYAEGVINKVKVIKRRAYGLPTFSGFRRRVVIACG